MADNFEKYTSGLDSPARSAIAITPNDGADLANATRALYVGGAGNIAVVTVGENTVTFNAVPAGMILPVRVKRVLATGTTAENIVALW
jgi:hypothetical protein